MSEKLEFRKILNLTGAGGDAESSEAFDADAQQTHIGHGQIAWARSSSPAAPAASATAATAAWIAAAVEAKSGAEEAAAAAAAAAAATAARLWQQQRWR